MGGSSRFCRGDVSIGDTGGKREVTQEVCGRLSSSFQNRANHNSKMKIPIIHRGHLVPGECERWGTMVCKGAKSSSLAGEGRFSISQNGTWVVNNPKGGKELNSMRTEGE